MSKAKELLEMLGELYEASLEKDIRSISRDVGIEIVKDKYDKDGALVWVPGKDALDKKAKDDFLKALSDKKMVATVSADGKLWRFTISSK